jgi:hypothetical protein
MIFEPGVGLVMGGYQNTVAVSVIALDLLTISHMILLAFGVV